MRKRYKKGQLSIADAPQVVLIVGLVFLVMATIALIAGEYGEALDTRNSDTIVNETITDAQRSSGTYKLAGISNCNAQDFTITSVLNATDGSTVASGNYSVNSATAIFTNLTGEFTTESWDVTYNYNFGGVSCNVTADLQSEIADNTSIAGIVLTISLVGIVLTVLVGIFVGISGRRV